MDKGLASSGVSATGAPLGIAGVLARLADVDGAGGHAWCRHLATTAVQPRDLGDAVHALCILHGHHPGMADAARTHGAVPDAADWLAAAADGFAAERSYLARLASAAGPLPSTPGHAESQQAITAQRHALEMLAGSDRSGCAIGAIAALTVDWHAIRHILDAAATRYGIAAPALLLPSEADTAAAIIRVANGTGGERAISFGAQQLLTQHRGLWGLLEARAEARDHS